ncbi:uncharacterized protein [Rhodnius prolixus]|uniref:uncharacterized protein n=1 Tax=Rhodnius prolixus TaxID=13249 RepID=UPI003D1878F2
MASAADSYLQISMVFCAVNCTTSASTLLPDCENSLENCCSPDPMNCFSYYTCYNDQPQKIFCGPLQNFNEQKLLCENNEEVCYPKCATRCPTDDIGHPICNEDSGSCCLPNPYNCKYFLTCSNGQTGLGECPSDAIFDEQQLACLPQPNGGGTCYQDEPICTVSCDTKEITCKEDCCGPETSTCSQQYYRCTNGIRTMAGCPNLTTFNMNTLQCDRHSYDKCVAQDTNFVECAPTPTNPAVNYPTSPPSIPTTGGQTVTESRRLLSKEEFLTAMYSAYREMGERLTIRT